VTVLFVEDAQAALDKLLELLPPGARTMSGGSTTLEQTGFVDYLIEHPERFRNLKGDILATKDPRKQTELRRKATVAEYWLGSVHGIAETGEVVVASATGSQLGGYVYGGRYVIWVAGTHKIVPTLEEAVKRTLEYSMRLEDERMKKLGASGTTLGKMLIFHRELAPGRITMILVKQVLGF